MSYWQKQSSEPCRTSKLFHLIRHNNFSNQTLGLDCGWDVLAVRSIVINSVVEGLTIKSVWDILGLHLKTQNRLYSHDQSGRDILALGWSNGIYMDLLKNTGALNGHSWGLWQSLFGLSELLRQKAPNIEGRMKYFHDEKAAVENNQSLRNSPWIGLEDTWRDCSFSGGSPLRRQVRSGASLACINSIRSSCQRLRLRISKGCQWYLRCC